MTTSVLLQSLIVAGCVLFAGVYMLGRYAPKLVAIPRAWFAQQLQRRGHERAAAFMRPAAKSGGGCHDGGGDDACGSCGNCGTSSDSKTNVSTNNEQPLIFHRKH
jgi:hypothetical protein